jgi:Zn-dependent peptidase ImmA (M78 family)
MAVLRRPFERARRLAREVLWECGMDEPSKIDPFVIVGRHKIEVTYAKLDGASARIFRHGDRAIIRVSDQIVQLGRLRFTIAHEVAHFLLGHKIPVEVVLDANGRSPFSVHQEREADVFATEFLMPAAWVAAYCKGTVTSLSVVHAIAQAFRVSNVAAAVRRVELTDGPCAVAYSEHGRVEWAKRSGTFPHRIQSQRKIGSGSVASEYFERGVLDSASRSVPTAAWFGTDTAPNIGPLIEHAELVPEPGWGGVMSLLSIAPATRVGA